MEKRKHAEDGTSVAATPPGGVRDAAHKWERDVEVKASVRDDPRELEKIKQMQIDKNFNWLSAYTIYMGMVLQAYPGQGSALMKYQDLIHRAAWLHYVFTLKQPWTPRCHEIWSTINSGHSACALREPLQAGMLTVDTWWHVYTSEWGSRQVKSRGVHPV
ncbi:UNVERIFIED_CONTAM: hypothetical protein K2H54_043003 [Gekko kuhli]